MFNFHLYNGSLLYRMFMALTVALCIWGIMNMTTQALVVSVPEEYEQEVVTESELRFHRHEGDASLGTGCYGKAIFHEHTGSKHTGSGCYTAAVRHSHTGDAQTGGGCYGEGIFHSHTGSGGSGGGCYQNAVCHNHSGNSEQGGGCYTVPICHSHQGDELSGGACYATPIYHQHTGDAQAGSGCYTLEGSRTVTCTYMKTDATQANSPHTDCRTCNASTAQTMNYIFESGHTCGKRDGDVWGESICSSCGTVAYSYGMNQSTGVFSHEYEVKAFEAGCGMTEETVIGYAFSCPLTEDYVEAYGLGCGRAAGSVEWYQLSCGKNETSVEGYSLSCGMQDGQILEYKRTCGMSKDDIIGYELSCGMDENTEVVVEVKQPVKVPINLTHETEEIPQCPAEQMTGVLSRLESDILTEEDTLESDKPEGILQEESIRVESTMPVAIVESEDGIREILLFVIPVLAIVSLCIKWYFAKTVALYYYDEANQYHSLGRIGVKRSKQGYHVEIGSSVRRKATTDRYRIRISRAMQRASKDAYMFVRISSQVMKLGMKEYVDFAL